MDEKSLRRRLDALAKDLRWAWCPAAQRAFAAVDSALWEATRHAPLELLRRARPELIAARAADPGYARLVSEAERRAREYHAARPWFGRAHARKEGDLRVAYFCSEYALHESLPQYSGGLGVLAGDHLKSASDLGVPLVAVGLLYRHGYYVQELEADGSTRALYPRLRFEDLPLEETGAEIECPVGRGLVRAKVWRLAVGRVDLYLLDADLADAPKAHRGGA